MRHGIMLSGLVKSGRKNKTGGHSLTSVLVINRLVPLDAHGGIVLLVRIDAGVFLDVAVVIIRRHGHGGRRCHCTVR